MSASIPARPAAAEYAPYHEAYISLVPEGAIDAVLADQLDGALELLTRISESRANHRYAADKWSIKEVVGHITDTERIFGDRVLRIARGDQARLPGFDQDSYVRAGEFDARTLADLAEELRAVRNSSLALLRSLGKDAWLRRGVANEVEISARALAYLMAGHAGHHINILKNKYLDSNPE